MRPQTAPNRRRSGCPHHRALRGGMASRIARAGRLVLSRGAVGNRVIAGGEAGLEVGRHDDPATPSNDRGSHDPQLLAPHLEGVRPLRRSLRTALRPRPVRKLALGDLGPGRPSRAQSMGSPMTRPTLETRAPAIASGPRTPVPRGVPRQSDRGSPRSPGPPPSARPTRPPNGTSAESPATASASP